MRPGREFQHVERQAFGLCGIAAGLRLRGALLEQRQMTARLAGAKAREVELTAMRARQSAAARA